MRRHIRIRSMFAGLLAFVLIAGAGLAEDWPSETVSDAAGNTYKQVKKKDGGVEVWQFIGVFGSPDEALELVGLKKEEGKKGKETIGDVPYEFDLKKLTAQEDEKVKILDDGESVIFGVKSGDSARVIIKAEEDYTSITGLESVIRDAKTDDKILFGDTEKENNSTGSSETVYETEQGSTTVLNPGEKFTFKVTNGSNEAARVEVKHKGKNTYVIPVSVKKFQIPAIRIRSKKPETVSKPEIGTLKGKTQTDIAEEETPKKTPGRRRQRTIGGIIPIEQINWGFNQIFIQENRASGR